MLFSGDKSTNVSTISKFKLSSQLFLYAHYLRTNAQNKYFFNVTFPSISVKDLFNISCQRRIFCTFACQDISPICFAGNFNAQKLLLALTTESRKYTENNLNFFDIFAKMFDTSVLYNRVTRLQHLDLRSLIVLKNSRKSYLYV